MSPLVFRKQLRLWPFVLHFGNNGWTSTSIKIGRFTHNITRGTTAVDLPGPVNWRSKPKRRRTSRRPA